MLNVALRSLRQFSLQCPEYYFAIKSPEKCVCKCTDGLADIESFLKFGMDPRESHWTDGFVNSGGLFSSMGKGEGPDQDCPLISAISYDCLDVTQLMENYGMSLQSRCAGKNLLAHANEYGSKKIIAFLSTPR
jgi:hypothetical protein